MITCVIICIFVPFAGGLLAIHESMATNTWFCRQQNPICTEQDQPGQVTGEIHYLGKQTQCPFKKITAYF